MSTPGTTAPAEQPTPAAAVSAPPSSETSKPTAPPPTAAAPTGKRRRWWLYLAGCVMAVPVPLVGVPWVVNALTTVSTDDAYVNGHVTFVAPRVAGQVWRVSGDDNNRVKKDDLLVQLDPEPYVVQVNIAEAAVAAAQAELVVAQAAARATQGQMRSLRFALDRAVEDVGNQIALLRLKVAALKAKKESLIKAKSDYDTVVPLVKDKTVSVDEFIQKQQAFKVAQAEVEEALQGVFQVRVSLGLPAMPEKGDDLTQTPENLVEIFSTVRQAQNTLLQAAAQLGVTISFNKTPREMISDFYKRDPSGDIDRILDKLLQDAPAIKQAEAKLAQAKRNLEQAKLNLRYCDIVAEIDGVVTRRNVNPGNNVVVGQSLMAVRSLTEIWVDANFKETQLADLRIGQPVDLDVDMYGSRKRFKGRISGFTMGTGSTLALLPAENATGNFVKVVQRLPVRIDLEDYDPERQPLFIGLSVTPRVRVQRTDDGKMLQPNLPLPSLPSAGTKR